MILDQYLWPDHEWSRFKLNFQEAADELRGIIESPEMPKGVPILILANKQDLPQASRPSAIADKLQLHSYRFLYLSCCRL